MSRAVHVHPARHPLADKLGRLEPPVPPPMGSRHAHPLLRIGGEDPSTSAALFGVEQEAIGLRRSVNVRKCLQEIPLDLQHDSAAERDDPTFLALAKDSHLPSPEIKVTRLHARQLRASEPEVEQEEKRHAVAGDRRCVEQSGVSISRKWCGLHRSSGPTQLCRRRERHLVVIFSPRPERSHNGRNLRPRARLAISPQVDHVAQVVQRHLQRVTVGQRERHSRQDRLVVADRRGCRAPLVPEPAKITARREGQRALLGTTCPSPRLASSRPPPRASIAWDGKHCRGSAPSASHTVGPWTDSALGETAPPSVTSSPTVIPPVLTSSTPPGSAGALTTLRARNRVAHEATNGYRRRACSACTLGAARCYRSKQSHGRYQCGIRVRPAQGRSATPTGCRRFVPGRTGRSGPRPKARFLTR